MGNFLFAKPKIENETFLNTLKTRKAFIFKNYYLPNELNQMIQSYDSRFYDETLNIKPIIIKLKEIAFDYKICGNQIIALFKDKFEIFDFQNSTWQSFFVKKVQWRYIFILNHSVFLLKTTKNQIFQFSCKTLKCERVYANFCKSQILKINKNNILLFTDHDLILIDFKFNTQYTFKKKKFCTTSCKYVFSNENFDFFVFVCLQIVWTWNRKLDKWNRLINNYYHLLSVMCEDNLLMIHYQSDEPTCTIFDFEKCRIQSTHYLLVPFIYNNVSNSLYIHHNYLIDYSSNIFKYDLKQNEFILLFTSPNHMDYIVPFTNTKHLLICFSSNKCYIYDLRQQQIVKQLDNFGYSFSFQQLKDGHILKLDIKLKTMKIYIFH